MFLIPSGQHFQETCLYSMKVVWFYVPIQPRQREFQDWSCTKLCYKQTHRCSRSLCSRWCDLGISNAGLSSVVLQLFKRLRYKTRYNSVSVLSKSSWKHLTGFFFKKLKTIIPLNFLSYLLSNNIESFQKNPDFLHDLVNLCEVLQTENKIKDWFMGRNLHEVGYCRRKKAY